MKKYTYFALISLIFATSCKEKKVKMNEEIKVNLSSRKQKVEITSELLHTLEEKDVHYKLN